MRTELIIDDELRELIPPLSTEERATLEESILFDGIRDAIAVWDGVIVDGHNRYEIAQKHGLEFKTREMGFRNRGEAMLWMIDNQRGRRNLSKQAWLDLGFKRAELLKPRAEDNRLANLKQNQDENTEGQKSDFRSYDTLTEAADYAGVSRDTAAKYKRVMSDAPEEIRDKVRSGEMKINRAYQEIKKPKEEDPEDEGPNIDPDFLGDVAARPTEDEQKKEQGEKYALSIIQFAEKLLHATEPRTKSTAISALDQWIQKQKESI